MNVPSQFRLLAELRFGPFFGVQFVGALNDNVFKQGLVILLAYQTASFTAMSSDTLQNLAQALFILPFFLFSATAGQLADKYEKSRLITITVALELGVMFLGAAGFFLQSLGLLLAALFLGGVQSALFGPVKYAILPQHLRESELVGGHALVETGTSIAILAGMILGGWNRAVALCSALARAGPGARYQPEPAAGDVANSAVRRPQPDGFSLDPGHLVVLVLRRAAGHPVSEPGAQRPAR